MMKNPPASQPAPRTPPAYSQPAVAILDIAERLIQTRGYNAFSYADIATELHVTKASLHYHFRSKEDLGRTLIQRYQASFGVALGSISRPGHSPLGKLRKYIGLYDSVLRNERMCLCGILAAEYSTLPASMQEALTEFFDVNERWLTGVLAEGRQSGAFKFTESARERARVMLGALEGAMLIARSYKDPRRFRIAAQLLLRDFC